MDVRRSDGRSIASLLRKTFDKWLNSWTSEGKAHRYTLLVFFAMGVALRSAYLMQPMRYDESFTYIAFVARPIPVGLSWYPYPNNHLLNTLLSHFSTGILGNEPWIIRLPSFIAGILIIPATYLVVRKLYNKQSAIIAVALVVPSSLLIDFSTQSRGYTIQVLLFLVMILLAVRILRIDKFLYWAYLSVAGVLCFYAIPTTLYFFPPILIWMLISGFLGDANIQKRTLVFKVLMTASLVAVTTVILYLPVVLRTGLPSLVSNKYVQSLLFKDFLGELPQSMSNMWSSWNIMIPLPLALFILLGYFVSVLFHRRISRHPVNLTLVIFVWCVIILFTQRVVPFARSWMPLLPLFLGCSSAGLYFMYKHLLEFVSKRIEKKAGLSTEASSVLIISLSLILAGLVVLGQTPFQRDELGKMSVGTLRDAEAITLFLKKELREGDIVYSDYDYSSVPLEYYFRKYNIPVRFLAMNVPLEGSFPPRIPAWNPPGLRQGGTKNMKRAFFAVSEKEGHTLDHIMSFASQNYGGFNPTRFEESATPVFSTGFTELLVSNRKTDTAATEGRQ